MTMRLLLGLGFAFSILVGGVAFAAPEQPIPAPKVDVPRATAAGNQTAVFAGGCFWGTQAVFERVKGVVKTTTGYSGGSAATATYGQVITETTGHAESVEVVYDPSRITYGTAAAHLLFRRARSHAAEPAGAGCGHFVPLCDFLHE